MQDALIVQLARMGDLLQSKRLVLSVAAEPGTRVHLCVDKSLASFAKQVYPFAYIHPIVCHGGMGQTVLSALLQNKDVFHTFKSINFKDIYLLNSSPLSIAIARLFPENATKGFFMVGNQPTSSAWVKLAGRITRNRRSSPLNLVDYWGFFHPSPIAPERVNPVASGARSGSIGLVMAGRVKRRSLSLKDQALCLEAIFKARSGPDIVCLGSKDETPLVRQLARMLPRQIAEKLVDTTGKTSLTDLPDILHSLDLLLSPDTGLMHLAAHLGVPIQAFFMSSAWCFETGPYGLGHKVWQASASCSPCLESAPCSCGEICHQPFSDTSFITHLSGKYAENWPEGLSGFTTYMDELGCCYEAVDGQDSYLKQRNELRMFLAENQGLGMATDVSPTLADTLSNETDWVLPWNLLDKTKEKICAESW